MYNLAHCYEFGEDIEKDILMAINLYKQSVNLGNDNAMYILAQRYAIGKGIEKKHVNCY